MLYVFDLDGTLVDSHDVLRHCYTKAGAPPPPDFFNLSGWQAWATEEQHELKNAFYALAILTNGINTLPLIDLYRNLLKSEDATCEIWTGASFPAVQAVRISVPELTIYKNRCGLSINDKIQLLRELAPNKPITIFDDSEVACKSFQTVEGVTVCHVRY